MKCFSLLVLSMLSAIFEASGTTLLRGGSTKRLVEGQSALSEVASSVMQTVASTLKAIVGSPWVTLGLLVVIMIFLLIVSCWSLAMRESSTPMEGGRAAAAPERRLRVGIPQTAPAGITVRVPPPQTRQPTGRTVPKPPHLPDVAGVPADARPSVFKGRPSTAMWQGACGPEVTQYRVWEDPRRQKSDESAVEPLSRSSRSSDEETHTLVNFLKPPSFDSPIPGLVPQASDIKGWLDQVEHVPQRKSMANLPVSHRSLEEALDREARGEKSI